jgi:hypothetical protein
MSIAETTQKQYDYYISQLQKKTDKDILDTKSMIAAVEGLTRPDGSALAPTTKRNYYIALAYKTKSSPTAHTAYRAAYQALNKAIKKGEAKATPSPAIGYSDLQTIGKMIVQEDEETLENRILAGLITQLPPVRLDYARLRVFTKVPKDYAENYILLKGSPKTSQFVAQRHKTSKTYGALQRTLTPELYDVVKEWKTKHPDDVLLDMSDNLLGRKIAALMKKYVGDSITMNDIRHSYVSAARKGDRSKADVESIAHMLGHSLAMNYDYRRD